MSERARRGLRGGGIFITRQHAFTALSASLCPSLPLYLSLPPHPRLSLISSLSFSVSCRSTISFLLLPVQVYYFLARVHKYSHQLGFHLSKPDRQTAQRGGSKSPSSTDTRSQTYTHTHSHTHRVPNSSCYIKPLELLRHLSPPPSSPNMPSSAWPLGDTHTQTHTQRERARCQLSLALLLLCQCKVSTVISPIK